MNEPDLIHSILDTSETIAVIGLSADPAKPSHYVSAYMQQQGYKLYPVNPSLLPTPGQVLGEPAYAALAALPIRPAIVNVFRVPSFLPAIVDEMLELGLRTLWVQQGIVNREAAARAEEGGIRVIMDRCLMVEHRRHNP